MPTLPTLTVTDTQMQRLLAVFVDGPTYKAWLKEQLIAEVIAHEQRAIQEQAEADKETKRADVVADLGTAT